MPDDIPSISSARLVAADVVRHSFQTVRRGFDPQEVRAFLELVARELAASEQREADLRRQVGEAEDRARNPVFDEPTLTGALGQRSAEVLREAHEAAAAVRLRAEEEAAQLVREAQHRAAELRVEAESAAAERIAAAEVAVNSIDQQARAEVAELLGRSRGEATAITEEGRERGEALVAQAQAMRRRVLEDMAQRRRAMTHQIEQFRAARDELAASVQGLRRSVDRIADELSGADDRARAAAAEVGSREGSEVGVADLMVEVESAEVELDGRSRAEEIGEDLGVGMANREPAGRGPAGVEEAVVTDGSPPGEEASLAEEADEAAGAEKAVAAEKVVGRNEPDGPVERVDQVDRVDQDRVEGLFARLRAGAGSAGKAEDNGDAGDAGREPGDGGGRAVGGEAARDREDRDEAGSDRRPDGPAGLGGEGEEKIAGRLNAERLAPLSARLARKLKRALQDDQNRMLERLRNSSGSVDGGALAAQVQRELFVEAATEALVDAVRSGAEFSVELRQAGGVGGIGSAEEVFGPGTAGATGAEVAAGLAETVVAVLRNRFEEVQGDPDAAAERIGAAYRQWRGERIERLVGDSVLQAFSSGILSASGDRHVRWVAVGSPVCADCDDNALGGPVVAGAEFPTGHRQPPAHPGCRCVIVPTSDR